MTARPDAHINSSNAVSSQDRFRKFKNLSFYGGPTAHQPAAAIWVGMCCHLLLAKILLPVLAGQECPDYVILNSAWNDLGYGDIQTLARIP